MSIRPFENLNCSQLESILRDGYTINLFRLDTHIFLSLYHQRDLLARATGESISTVLKRANSYIGSQFTMPELYREHHSKLDSLILNSNAIITIDYYENQFRGKISSHSEYLLSVRKGDSISQALQSLEESAIQYGL